MLLPPLLFCYTIHKNLPFLFSYCSKIKWIKEYICTLRILPKDFFGKIHKCYFALTYNSNPSSDNE